MYLKLVEVLCMENIDLFSNKLKTEPWMNLYLALIESKFEVFKYLKNNINSNKKFFAWICY